MEKFEEAPEGVEIDVSGTPVTGASGKEDQAVAHSFSNGDNVEVCEGELINLQGKIVSIDGNMIMVMPKHEDLKEALEFQASELRKYFTQGDHVKVKYLQLLIIDSVKKKGFFFHNITMRL